MRVRHHKTALPAVNTDTSLGGGGHGDVNGAGGGIPLSPSPAPAPPTPDTSLRERLAESERARQLAVNQVAEMQAAQRRQQQEVDPKKQRFLNEHHGVDMQRLGDLHRTAIISGLRDNSDEYFSYLDRALAEPPATTVEAPSIEPEPEPAPKPLPPPPEPERNYAVSAPVHREHFSLDSGRPDSYSSKVLLTKEQREHCKLSGIDEATYARGVLRLEREKRAGTRQA